MASLMPCQSGRFCTSLEKDLQFCLIKQMAFLWPCPDPSTAIFFCYTTIVSSLLSSALSPLLSQPTFKLFNTHTVHFSLPVPAPPLQIILE